MQCDAVEEIARVGLQVRIVGAADMAFESSGACDAGEGEQALPHGALWYDAAL